ncbi:peritrophin-1-like [Arctopsyche grandis]|uniref:peritrophin-1-like n=1 Tax=Arctopsyche grandis TaxID=121162 RepID=UPI00406DA1A1
MKGLFILAIVALLSVIVSANVPKCPPFNPSLPALHLPDIDDCSRFYHCDEADIAVLDNCPGGLWFNPDLSVCDRPENVKPGVCTPPPGFVTPTSAYDIIV